MTRRSAVRLSRAALAAGAVLLVSCGQNPATTEEARGVLEGTNVVLALSVLFLVIAGALLAGVLGLDRFVRTRDALSEAPPAPVEEEDEDEVMAGIGVGRAGVPKWLYGFYVVIPVFAFMYVVNSVALSPPADEHPEETAAPTGPVTEITVVASGIAFELDTLTFPAETEVTVTMDNQDAGVPHDLTIWESEAAAQANDEAGKIAATNQVSGPNEAAVTFQTPGVGEYYFNCTIHPPSMAGTVEVVAAAG